MEEGPEKLKIKGLVDRRDKQQILVIQSISKNHIKQEKKTQV